MVTTHRINQKLGALFILFLLVFFTSGCSLFSPQMNNSASDFAMDMIRSIVNNISRSSSLPPILIINSLQSSLGHKKGGIYSELSRYGILMNSTSAIILFNFSNISILPNKEYKIPFKAFCNGRIAPIQYYPPASEEGKLILNDSAPRIIHSKIGVTCGNHTKIYNYSIRLVLPNKPPVIIAPHEVISIVGEPLNLSYYIYDLDSDFINFWIDGWKTSLSYTPTPADVGTHKIYIHASDEENHVERELLIQVVNTNYSNFFKLKAIVT